MGIPIWKRGLTHPHKEIGYPCFHMGNQMKGLPVSIRGSPFRNGDWHVPVSIRGPAQSLTRSKTEFVPVWGLRKKTHLWMFSIWGLPFPYGDPHMETGRQTKNVPFGDTPFQNRVCSRLGINIYMFLLCVFGLNRCIQYYTEVYFMYKWLYMKCQSCCIFFTWLICQVKSIYMDATNLCFILNQF